MTMIASTKSRIALAIALAAAGALAFVLVTRGSTTEYGTDHRAITVEKGEDFTLKVPARPYIGEHWFLAEPKPDADVLDYRGTHEDIEGAPEGIVGGGDGTAYFDFTARSTGTTTVTLLHCPMARCGSLAQAQATTPPVPTAPETAEPADEPAYFQYKITVR
ncbi:hypothetical protein Stsp02_67960 [Streptomyces sp. NBRC 14336]|uniref:protease inhibitor I42 family protein n=1 Tax=Streptomyces sp. DI166 TaxID=1839783 RepID=UPI0007F3BADF|nr:protease inhibitor I42 family protein [Streptomyces sp. DI166]WBO78629.1 protease inhibitor I42 family protein [Streptomyces sp. SBE_14.2]GLW51135.1 hypothetical protein Stsp02_67960 [Streptomyces sp. NBRC 14336]SBT89836.1 Chagasin family peptidase inhibitor I42 [Streptomyces sp. DI166]